MPDAELGPLRTSPADLHLRSAPIDAAAERMYFLSVLSLLAIGVVMFDRGRDLAMSIRNVDRRSQERQWEDFPNE